MYARGEKPIRRDVYRAMELYEFAAEHGPITALASMAMLFHDEGQVDASEHHWVRYFEAAVQEARTASRSGNDVENYARRTAAIYGGMYYFMVANGDIADVVPREYLQFFEEELEQRLLEKVAEFDESNPMCAAYSAALDCFRRKVMR